ncbi:ubl carboxyl-terminal hydrolase 18-like [Dipodomys spectabilis]|uniref:ubl carboxyl-terminal hydrolase 18-like n=1 Tax=Dipodomys spectabilis TaxID=105255 RepID=UPI001C539FA8|nr:ubl carboxyl-terminal hydrolase 18-like [Dipodomys spectabilis]XP_042528097.1 ubl carboxyl-terminal hydrolase 18-like [Dipodomys spectabilis]
MRDLAWPGASWEQSSGWSEEAPLLCSGESLELVCSTESSGARQGMPSSPRPARQHVPTSLRRSESSAPALAFLWQAFPPPLRLPVYHTLQMFVQHDAAQLYLTFWNLLKDQIDDVDLVERLQALYTIRVKESLVCLLCTRESSRNSSMLTLSLPLYDVDAKPLQTLEEALRCFFHPRELASKSKWFCEACGTKTFGSQVLRMTHLPQTLTLHLMRFSIRNSQTEKVCHLLHFPQRLDLSQVLLAEHQDFTEDAEQREAQYELFAVIAHVGMADFGHYCAYIRNPADGRWLCFNDSNVCWVSWEDVQCTYGNHHYRWQETAYLLVYMKIRG